MVTQFTFYVSDEPGMLGKIAEVIGKSGVNIDGIAGFADKERGVINIITNDSAQAESALNNAKINYNKQEVFKIHLQDQPGQLAKFTRALSVEGINMNAFYISMDRHQVIGVDDFEHAQEIAKHLGIVD